eukprot:746885-Hanusia_phi.AAC.3
MSLGKEFTLASKVPTLNHGLTRSYMLSADEEDVSVEQQEVPELESIMAATLSLGSGESSEVSGKKKAAGKK